MKKAALGTAAMFVAALFMAGTSLAADYGKSEKKQSQTGTQSSQPGMTGQSGQMGQSGMTGQTARTGQMGQQQIRAASDIQNFNVQTASGERLGKVDKVVVDLEKGQIGYVTVAAQQGTDKYIIPWKAVRADAQQQALIVSMSSEQLRQAPKGDIQQVNDLQKAREIHQFFGVSPYWEETGASQRSQQPGMQHPGMQQPGMQQPGMQQPGMPSGTQRGTQQPGQTQPERRPGSGM